MKGAGLRSLFAQLPAGSGRIWGGFPHTASAPRLHPAAQESSPTE